VTPTYYSFNFTGPKAEFSLVGDLHYKSRSQEAGCDIKGLRPIYKSDRGNTQESELRAQQAAVAKFDAREGV